jgi:DNA-binding MarR family transcriptional regulator
MESNATNPIPIVTQASEYRLDQSVGYLIKRVRAALSTAVDRELTEFDVSHDQWSILLMIATSRGDTAAELSREMSCETSSMTRMLDRLEAKGLVIRTRSEDDRRVVHLATTPAGQALADQLPEVMIRVMNRHLAGFSSEEVTTLKSFLRRMLENAAESASQVKASNHASHAQNNAPKT